MLEAHHHARFPVRDYDLHATLDSGQAFRWRRAGDAWEGVVNGCWVRLRRVPDAIESETVEAFPDRVCLGNYLQTGVDLAAVIATFPDEEPMRGAVRSCHGLRLLRQDPWECLASFILSSTKQIVQIRQIIELLCRRYGSPARVPSGHEPVFSFPAPERIAAADEEALRGCKTGFRARGLLEAARAVRDGTIDLAAIGAMPLAEARSQLMTLHGVGRKIADCVLLFAYGFQQAFPIDVWVMKTLRELYFRGRKAKLRRLMRFSEEHFGPFAGYAQQYLFHHARLRARTPLPKNMGCDKL